MLIGVPGNIKMIQIMPEFTQISVTWEAQSDTGCSVIYQVKAYRVFTNTLIFSFNKTDNSFTITHLDPDSLYMISLRAINELGVSNYSNFTVRTNAVGKVTINYVH